MTATDAPGPPPPAKQPPNRLLEAARIRLPSPAGAPRPMSRQELAEAVNHYLWTTHQTRDNLDRGDIGAYERGEIRWPSERRREAFRAVLGATDDHQLGFYTGKTPQPTAERNTPGPELRAPGKARRRPRRRNDLIRRARLSLASPSHSGGPMSRAELAEAVNAYLHHRGVKAFLTDRDIARYERGETRWPRAHHRRGLREVLGAETDVQLGLFNTRPHPSSEEPLRADQPGGGPAEAGADWWVAGAVAPPVVSLPPRYPPRVVLHWTGPKAYALRVAMRMSVRDFAAKLGINQGVVGQWPHGGRLRYETHRILDTMLSLATDDDLLRFDLALQEIGESR